MENSIQVGTDIWNITPQGKTTDLFWWLILLPWSEEAIWEDGHGQATQFAPTKFPPMPHFVIGSGSIQTPPAKSITHFQLGNAVRFLTFISPAAATSSRLWQMVAMAFLAVRTLWQCRARKRRRRWCLCQAKFAFKVNWWPGSSAKSYT